MRKHIETSLQHCQKVSNVCCVIIFTINVHVTAALIISIDRILTEAALDGMQRSPDGMLGVKQATPIRIFIIRSNVTVPILFVRDGCTRYHVPKLRHKGRSAIEHEPHGPFPDLATPPLDLLVDLPLESSDQRHKDALINHHRPSRRSGQPKYDGKFQQWIQRPTSEEGREDEAMDNVENHKVKNTGANQHLIVVQDGFDAVQCREEVTNEQCCQVKQGVKQES